LLPFLLADGAYNMATDEALLLSAAQGTASLRFYGWSHATLSLGYFQPERLRYSDSRLASLPYVRRPSGGDTLVHHHEVTYALALPAGPPWQARGEPWSRRMHLVIAAALKSLAVDARLHVAVGKRFEGALCFEHFSGDDLLIGDAKVVGSAQRRHRGAILQHGAILLATSPHAPMLPGIWELTGRELTTEGTSHAIRQELVLQTGWQLVPDGFTDVERQRIGVLVAERYTQDKWNRKR
jgi:lipoate-protein ligase A